MWSMLCEQRNELTATIRSSVPSPELGMPVGIGASAPTCPWAGTVLVKAELRGRSARRSARTTKRSCCTICLLAGFSRERYLSSYCASCADVSERCRALSMTECISLIVSMRL
eukprot:scaffold85916_cov30-Tisochrysis_lutea.AAC.6